MILERRSAGPAPWPSVPQIQHGCEGGCRRGVESVGEIRVAVEWDFLFVCAEWVVLGEVMQLVLRLCVGGIGACASHVRVVL